MRTHVWRKQLVRLSQRNQRLPFQRRRPFSTSVRRLDNHNDPATGPGTETTTTKEAQPDAVNKHVSHGRRRAGYARRTKEVAPFSVPDWFLRHNVRLHAPNPDATAPGESKCWTLVDNETGHTVLTLPFSELPQQEGQGQGQDQDQTQSSDFFTPSTTDKPNESPVEPSPEQSAEASAEKSAETSPGQPAEDAAEKVNGQVAGQSQEDSAPPAAHTKEHETSDKIKRATRSLSPDLTRGTPDAHTLVSLQLQLLLEAAFSLAGPASSRFPKCNIDLHSHSFFAHKEMDAYVRQMADLVGADVIKLDASDFADLGHDYVDAQDTEPGSISSLAYDTFKDVSAARVKIDIIQEPPAAEDDSLDPDSESDPNDFVKNDSMPDMDHLMDYLRNNTDKLKKALSSLGPGGGIVPISFAEPPREEQHQSTSSPSQAKTNTSITSWDELKLQALLDTILDSVQAKRDAPEQPPTKTFLFESSPSVEANAPKLPTKAAFERLIVDYLAARIDHENQLHSISGTFTDHARTSSGGEPPRRTIIHVRDMDHIRNQVQGEAIINRLVRVVQRRRKDGQQVVIFGTTASSRQALPAPGQEDDELYFRTLQYPSSRPAPLDTQYVVNVADLRSRQDASAAHATRQAVLGAHMQNDRSVAQPGYHRIFDVNLRHIHSMIRRLALPMSDSFFATDTRSHLNIPGTFRLGDEVLNQDEVQRLVLCADSLRSLYTNSPSLETFHIAFATMLTHTVDAALQPLISGHPIEPAIPSARPRGKTEDKSDATKSKLNVEKLSKSCSKHEKRLLSGVVDPASIKTTFKDVHADKSTIESLKTLTSLSLLRPEAFSYGILAADRLPGLLLYGPPGTGKTLLAKAVAKESSATVLEVSGAQVYEKYVGEGEKMVKAVFSLAKKLSKDSPCVVFIDEADALFGSRSGPGRTSHRELINQFLREWDGMDEHKVFMMVATNRPFDLDDAVLRRLPRRLLVDLPLSADRESILKIHLKDETLASSVSLSDLAKNTPLYSGSDLKNLCVSAALAAVREENESLEKARTDGDKDFVLPERRTLEQSHFDKALQEISASVSEDMATLGAIRKFDEQYGERRNRTKKAGWGFGVGASNAVDETGARVRPEEPSRGGSA